MSLNFIFSNKFFIKLLIIPVLFFTACDSSTSQKQNIPDAHSSQQELISSSDIKTLPGFEAQLLYEVPRGSQGTWIALTVDPEGNLIASDQSDKGFFRIKIGDDPNDPEVEVEEIVMPLSGANGLSWAFDYLYANVPGKGIFRMRDSRGNKEFDVMEFIGGPEKLAEHGNHGVLPSADNQGLFIINGNYTPPPQLTSSRLANWEEDLLLPRQWDIRGNARGIYAPGGYIARINPDATQWDMFSIGYRNPYDAAINPHGELFTFDSDMEYDLGMPWYRPTRLIHVVSGSDFGWRSGSGKWKDYYEDSLPAVLDIGRGSPTGLVFGTNARFPARYQHALFALDWIYGTIYAFHLTPKGASYSAEIEEFLSGNALPMTDAVVGKDGALYFVTGGRANDSKLYRVVYRGEKSTDPAPLPINQKAQEARELRRNLEAFHGKQDPKAIQAAWPHLDSEDRFIRHAARVAIEAQPVRLWADKALAEDRPQAKVAVLAALARSDAKEYREKAIQSLLEMNISTLEDEQLIGYLRTMALVFMRLGDPDKEQRIAITNSLQELLPGVNNDVNTELVRLLVYLKDSRVIDKTLALMQNTEEPSNPDWVGLLENEDGTVQKMLENPPPTEKLEYAFMLRNLREGWTIEQRREYFTFINEAAGHLGGSSYSGYLRKMRDDALSNASDEEHEAVADITGVNLVQEPPFEITPPEGPGRDWTVNEALGAVADHLTNRDFENGRNAFFATACASCHRFNGYGGNIGPDLSTIGLRSSVEVLLEDIIKPNALISDQYNTSIVTLKNGEQLTGLVVEEGDKLKVYPRDPEQPAAEINQNEVDSIEPSEISQMPEGLINTLNEEELRDLIAYLRSGGNPNSDLFKKE
ncbi:MAG: c-type cytochrome [Gracilimonas sp.]|uniref:c-type cytochrome n=1 Tax=Gracilimonas sp. TaxID=1974203 RepID=UPI00198BDC33|nr:c-type cytochrome [Gracilimonas sp.]MBD3615693.1 c-type cytochrome [Gracilimonas sp.]